MTREFVVIPEGCVGCPLANDYAILRIEIAKLPAEEGGEIDNISPLRLSRFYPNLFRAQTLFNARKMRCKISVCPCSKYKAG